MKSIRKETLTKYVEFLKVAFGMQFNAYKNKKNLSTKTVREIARIYNVGNNIWSSAKKLDPKSIEEIDIKFAEKVYNLINNETEEQKKKAMREEVIARYDNERDLICEEYDSLIDAANDMRSKKMQDWENRRRTEYCENGIPYTPETSLF